MNLLSTIAKIFNHTVKPYAYRNSEERLRKRFLNILLLGVFVIAIFIMLLFFYALSKGIAGSTSETQQFFIASFVVLSGIIIIYILNRFLSVELTSSLFLFVFLYAIAISDDPLRIVDGRGLFMFAIPILASSALIRPWASFAFAGLSTIEVVIIGMKVQNFPNIAAIGQFFILALISWLFASNLLKASRNIKLYAKKLETNSLDLKRAMENTINTMAKIVETRDAYTAGHQLRVSQLAVGIASRLHMDQKQIETIKMASLLHDIGKISIPTEILNKPGALMEMEFRLIQDHPQKGYEILKDIDLPWPIAEIILQHHERLDGSGYPLGLKNKQIRFEAKIIAVADVVEAMSSHRPYRPALGIETALQEIKKNRGRLYDNDVVDACIDLFHHRQFRFQS
mgnify:CR=1 FL=1